MTVDVDPPAPDRKLRRTWPQRLTIVGAGIAAVACFVAAGGLYAAQRVLEDRNLVEIVNPAAAADANPDAGAPPPATTIMPASADESGGSDGSDREPEPTAPPATFPRAEPTAKNFLITGADNNSCIDADSPYAPAFGDRAGFGERSDTIMMWRVNPATSQVAVLSFPRDLWVSIPGRSSQQRINVAYERDSPQLLIDTIYQNFGIPTDHYIQVDFCAFKTLVDAVDGVAVPFDKPARDPNTGLNVTEAGCFTFDGDHALAYVRSRKIELLDDNGEWQRDGSSDLGRISRQQDFIRRVADELLSAGTFDPAVIGGLVETNSDYVVVDSQLTTRKILEFAGVLRGVDPAEITTYQIEATPTNIQGNSVLEPRLGGSNMMAILSVFQGAATLASAPDPDAITSPDAGDGDGAQASAQAGDDADRPGDPSSAGDDSSAEAADVGGPDASATASTVPEVDAADIVYGWVPDPTVSC